MAKPSIEDVEAVTARLYTVGQALLAIHRLSIDAHDDDTGLYLNTVQYLARSTFKGVDACIERLQGGGGGIGGFETEFANE